MAPVASSNHNMEEVQLTLCTPSEVPMLMKDGSDIYLLDEGYYDTLPRDTIYQMGRVNPASTSPLTLEPLPQSTLCSAA